MVEVQRVTGPGLLFAGVGEQKFSFYPSRFFGWSNRRIDIRQTNMRKTKFKNMYTGASPVARWIRICLPKQGKWVRALVWEDPTCCGATKPVCHNY